MSKFALILEKLKIFFEDFGCFTPGQNAHNGARPPEVYFEFSPECPLKMYFESPPAPEKKGLAPPFKHC